LGGLSNGADIEDTLYKVFREDRSIARQFMKWRSGMKNAQRPKGDKRPADAIGNAI
jgi:hypothetical protein